MQRTAFEGATRRANACESLRSAEPTDSCRLGKNFGEDINEAVYIIIDGFFFLWYNFLVLYLSSVGGICFGFIILGNNKNDNSWYS